MGEYNFENFDDYEFELLCRDLLNEVQRIEVKSNHGLDYKHILSFSSFKRGKDEGVDLYFEDKKETVKVVGQVKLSRGKFSDLFSSLKRNVNGKNELSKVRKLNPSKYILMTSTQLSLANKRTLMEYFTPFILSVSDIFGKEDINALLSRFSLIEKRYVKLYFSNPLVLERLMNQATIKGSEFTQEEIESQIRYFVQTTNFPKALSILDKQNLLIIKGLPGVGKTTLAKMLSLYYIEKGYSFIEIFELDSEIERLIDANDEKCIFYYDDFLGSNSLIISDALKNEGRLKRLLRRIAQKSNKALIMTTRTNILKQAEFNSEKLSRIFKVISKYEAKIDSLTLYEKRKMLATHIKKNKLDHKVFENDLLFEKIVNHLNFSPRLIEYITDKSNFIHQKNNYSSFVLSSLKAPSEIWSYAYNFQISYVDKLFLNHLFLFGNSCPEIQFKNSFLSRIKYEVKNNNYSITSREFKESTTTMDGTFITIKSRFYNDELERDIEFLNPSIADFLLKEIKENTAFICGSISDFNDSNIILKRFNHSNKELLKLFTIDELSDILLKRKCILLFKEENEKIKYLQILSNYFPISKISNYFNEEILKILNTEIDYSIIEDYSEFLTIFKESNVVESHIKTKGLEIINSILSYIDYIAEIDNVLGLFKLFNLNFDSYIKNIDNRNVLFQSLKRVFKEAIDQYIYEQENIIDYANVNDIRKNVHEIYFSYEKIIPGLDILITQILDVYDWGHLINYHKFKNYGISEFENN
jgi:adenylate kinase family enzyme